MPKTPDFTQVALRVVQQATGEVPKKAAQEPKPQRKGGLAGGAARAAKLAPEERAAIAKKAAAARWKNAATEPAEGESLPLPKKARVRL